MTSAAGSEPMFAGIELGGTKCIAVVGKAGRVIKRAALPTRTPAETLPALRDILSGWMSTHRPLALGIASFGPLARGAAGGFDRMGRTPKAGWTGAAILDAFAPLGLPMAMETDVTGAAMAEQAWGDATGAPLLAYLTLGTGIGGALVLDGRPVQGRLHAEMGHLRVRRPAGDPFPGICPFHGDCLEGLASGPAIAARTGQPAESLPPDHPAWAATADALAEGLAILTLAASPSVILLGGGVALGDAFPLAAVQAGTAARLAGYVEAPPIRLASLGNDAGPLGALAVAARISIPR